MPSSTAPHMVLPERIRQRAALILLRLSGWPRRVAAVLLFALAAGLAVRGDPAASAPARPTAVVLIAARELPAGAVVRAADVSRARIARSAVPYGSIKTGDPPVGRSVAVPIRRGEILTDVRFIGQSLAAAVGGAGSAAVPVRLADADAARLLRPGDHLDVFATSPQDQTVRTLAQDAAVILVPRQDQDVGLDGALVLLATDPGTARRLATAAVSDRITVTLRADHS